MATSEARILVAASVALGICAVVLTGLVIRREMSQGTSRAEPNLLLRKAEWEVVVNKGNAVGDIAAKHTLLVFTDYQCPACRDFEAVVEQVLAQHSTVRVIYRHFPLRSIHPWAEAAAQAAECAAAQGVFARYHATLFAKQDSLGLLSWADIAGIAGVSDTQSFKECVDTGGGIARVADDLATAHSLELDRTPSVFLDGLRFARRPSLAALDTLVGATAKAQRD